MGTLTTWEGDEWESYIVQLLYMHYPPGELEPVPDEHRGDCGLEAFSLDGKAYQCYAPEGVLTTKVRYERIRDKITADLNKFRVKYKKDLTNILGGVKIRRWILVTPIFDSKQLIEHSNKKAQEVLAASLPYVDQTEFSVVVITDDAFHKERLDLLGRVGATSLTFQTSAPDQALIDELMASPFVQKISDKLVKVPALRDNQVRENYIRELLDAYVRGNDYRSSLADRFPEVDDDLDTVIDRYERSLTIRYAGRTDHMGTLGDLHSDLSNAIEETVSGIRRENVEAISWASTAKWLEECPLDFPASLPASS